jgi:tRNA(fMet)-specific endonuclease VapC
MKSLSFLIDTDWAIDHFNGVKHVSLRLKELQPRGLGLSVVSTAELWEGAYFPRDAKRSQETPEGILSGVDVLGLDEEICKRFGQLRGSMRKRGQTIGDFDLLIAATALRHNLKLLTNNRKHFEGIAGLEIESR